MSYYIWVSQGWDEFNRLFAGRGWIAHRWMDARIVERALGDVAEAVHNSGLLTLKAVLDSQRPETVVEGIEIPYRNGSCTEWIWGTTTGRWRLSAGRRCLRLLMSCRG
ncbi:hypothetical protein F183_A04130 [Bryobacterales bacterium F-183]|nr:hypothetical protein F183_A04130 [Bryobacterales bacterium F-183]